MEKVAAAATTNVDNITVTDDGDEVNVSNLIAIKTWPIFPQPRRLYRNLTNLQVEFFEDLRKQNFFSCPEEWFLSQKFLPFSGSCKSCGSTDFVIKRCKGYASLYGRVCANIETFCPINLFRLPKILRDHSLNLILKIIFHWTAQSDDKDVLESANVTATCVWDIYTKIREVCSAALSNKCFVLGAECDGVVQVTIVPCRPYFMLMCKDLKTGHTRMKLYKIDELKSCYIIQDLKTWCNNSTVILGHFPPSVKKHLGSDFVLLNGVITECKAKVIKKLTKLATRVITTLFGKSFNSQVDLKTMQALLDEVVWRQIYKVSSSYTFFNIFKQIIYYDEKSRRAHDESKLHDSNVVGDKSSTLTLPNSTNDHHTMDESVTFDNSIHNKKDTPETNKITYPSTLSLLIHNYSCFICTMHILGKIAITDHIHKHAISSRTNTIARKHSTVCKNSYFDCLESSTCYFIQQQFRKNHKKCSMCKITFQCVDDLDKHVTITHGATVQHYVCQMCNLGFSQHKAMKEHFYTDHIDTADLLCPYCLQSFPMTREADSFFNTELYCKHLVNHENLSKFNKNQGLPCSFWVVNKSASNIDSKHHQGPSCA